MAGVLAPASETDLLMGDLSASTPNGRLSADARV